MKRLLIAACAISLFSTGCDTYSHPTPELSKDEMKKNERVYGEVGGEARQHKNPNTQDPDQAVKADEIKKKLFAEEYPATAKAGAAMQVDLPTSPQVAPGAAPASDSGTREGAPQSAPQK